MPSGGKRHGAGRRKNKAEAPAPNKSRATVILDGLKLTDEQWKKQGHPDRESAPYGEPKPKNYGTPEDFIQAHFDWELAKRCQCEDCLWRRDCQDGGGGGRETRRYLWDRRDGHAVRNINHIHDKPLDLNVTVSMAEIVREVRQRKQNYERSRK
jgi:hypothetical protein